MRWTAGEAGITAFGTDPATGDLLAVDYGGSRILRMVQGREDPNSFPQQVSDTGLFADLTDLSPAPGLLPYAPNRAFWSDHAIKRRWFMLPENRSLLVEQSIDLDQWIPWAIPSNTQLPLSGGTHRYFGTADEAIGFFRFRLSDH
jgi:hypothetical protein